VSCKTLNKMTLTIDYFCVSFVVDGFIGSHEVSFDNTYGKNEKQKKEIN
jgi:hypothetical protein